MSDGQFVFTGTATGEVRDADGNLVETVTGAQSVVLTAEQAAQLREALGITEEGEG